MAANTYTLTINGNKITTGDGNEIDLGIKKTTGASASSKVSLEKLVFDKRVYQPCEILATVNIQSVTEEVTDKDNKKSVYYYLPTYDSIKSVFFRQKVKFTISEGTTDYTVGENYYVFKIRPVFQKSAVKLELGIYSMDKLMTVDKHNMAYTAKRLGLDILTPEATHYTIGSSSVPVKLELQLLYHELSITDSKKNTTKTNTELRIPYAVQYQESFYDFMVRMANRYGEFLFFEDGKLYLGLDITSSSHTTNKNTDFATKADEYYYETLVTDAVLVEDCHYPYLDRVSDTSVYASTKTGKIIDNLTLITDISENPKTEKTDHTADTDSDVTITTYYKEGTKVQTGVQDNKGVWKVGPFVTFTSSDGVLYEDTRHFFLSDPVAEDAYLEETSKNGFAKYNDEFWCNWRGCIVSDISTAMRDSTLMDMLLDVAAAEAWHAIHAGYTYYRANGDHNTTNIDPWTDGNHPDQAKNDKVAQFSTLDGSSNLETTMNNFIKEKINNLSAMYYAVVRKAEKDVAGDAVCLDFGSSYQHLKLGDLIKVNGKQYIVIRVKGSLQSETTDTTTTLTYKNKVVAIPLFKDVQVCPPAIPGMGVRKAESQNAFVAECYDPKRLGRVRIRYPWQTKDGDASPWIRVAQPMATNGGGINFRSEKGDEVMVDYEDGNIDRPYVVGFLQSKYCTEEWGAFPKRGIVSKNGHSLVFNDPARYWDFFGNMLPVVPYVSAMLPDFGLLHTDAAGLNELAGGITLTDRYGFYKISASTADRAVQISSPLGNVSLNAFTGISISAPNGNISISGKNVKISASNKIEMTSGKNVQESYLPFKGKGGFLPGLEGIGLNVLNKACSDIIDKVLDFTFIRTVYETFVRPVDGTTKIKSYTFLQIEAGNGSSEIPIDAYVKVSNGSSVVRNITKTASLLKSSVDDKINQLANKLEVMYAEFASFKREIGLNNVTIPNNPNSPNPNKDGAMITFETIRNHALSDDGDNLLTEANLIIDEQQEIWAPYEAKQFDEEHHPKPTAKLPGEGERELKARQDMWEEAKKLHNSNENAKVIKRSFEISALKEYVLNYVNKLRVDMYEAYKLAKEIADGPALTFTDKKYNLFKSEAEGAFKMMYADGDDSALITLIRNIKNHQNLTIDDTYQAVSEILKSTEGPVKRMHKRVVFNFLEEVANNDKFKKYFQWKGMGKNNQPIVKPDVTGDVDPGVWHTYLGGFTNKDVNVNPYKKVFNDSGVVNHFTDPFKNWTIPFKNKWSPDSPGKILLSDKAGKTISFDADKLETNDNVINVTDKVIIEMRKTLENI